MLVLIIGVLIAGSLWTLLPFLGALIWATAIVVATWPLLLWVQRLAGGRRSIATAVMTLIISIVFIVPFSVAVAALLDASADAIEIVRSYLAEELGPPLPWATFCGSFAARNVLGEADEDYRKYFNYFSNRRHFALPSGLGKVIGKPMLFSLANTWAKFFQVDTLRSHDETKKEF